MNMDVGTSGSEGSPAMVAMGRKCVAPAPPSRPVIEWEETSCLLCRRRNWSLLIEAPDTVLDGTGFWFAVVQCQDCGLCFTNPRPSLNSIQQFYPLSYQPHQTPKLRKRRRCFSSGGNWRRPRNERHALPWRGEGRLLDFGCGGGSYLERMARQGWRVTGIDVSESAVERVRRELNLSAIAGTLPNSQLQPNSFDVITMWHSLEHVHNPYETLFQAHRLLVDGGMLLVAVPNIDSLPFRVFGHAWFGLDLPRHLTHFTHWTLTLMLQQTGFRVQSARMVRHSDWMRSSARLAGRHMVAPRWRNWLKTKPISRIATWYSYWTRQADCMLVIAQK